MDFNLLNQIYFFVELLYNKYVIHLFAIAMMQSFNAGYNGYVTLEPKTIKELIAYYESIGAVYSPITGYMTFYPEASLKIVKKCITGGEQYGTKEFMEYI